MKKLKVMTVVGTRPEIHTPVTGHGKTRSVLWSRLGAGGNYDYELNQIFFDDLEVRKPDYFLQAPQASGAETIGKVIIGVDQALTEVKPDAMLNTRRHQ